MEPTGADAASHPDLGESSIDENEMHRRYAKMGKSFRQRLQLPLEKNTPQTYGAKKLEQLPPSSAEPDMELDSDLFDVMDDSEVVALI